MLRCLRHPFLHPYKVVKISKRSQYFSGDHVVPSQISGWNYMKNPKLNKGMAWTIEERQKLGIHGMFPAGFRTADQQVKIYVTFMRRFTNPLNKYLYLNDIRERNEKIFFRLISEHIEECMPIVYTPTVGLACQAYGMMYRIGRGLFISKYDRGHIKRVVSNWPETDVRAVCMTDGERILGLGDLGAFGMGIPVGKLSLYTAVAGIKPHYLLPICVDVGTNNEIYLKDVTYMGIREKRMTGTEYITFIDEIMEALVDRFSCNCLIQFEDFSNVNAFNFMHRYRKKYCTFNDDIQGTASAVLAGLLTAEKMSNMPIEDHKCVIFFGAGGANLGIAELMIKKCLLSGASQKEIQSRYWFLDVDGLITTNRRDLDPYRKPYAKDHAPTKDLEALVKELKPSMLIGASTMGGSFTTEILKEMGKNNEKPIVFALSNPTDKAECTAQQAYDHTEGRVIYASGSPMPPVQYNGKTYYTGQGNNSYVFPGVALAVIACKIHFVKPEFFLIAAQTIADLVTPEMMAEGRTYPPLDLLQYVSLEIATRISEYAYCTGLAMRQPKPNDIKEYIRSTIYSTEYDKDIISETWDWPKDSSSVTLNEKWILQLGEKLKL